MVCAEGHVIFLILLLLGKWCHVERYDVPEDHFQALLADMPNAFINSARDKRHFTPLYGKKFPEPCTSEAMKSRT